MSHAFTNRLINETSPYLLQHAHNPVDWYAWGEEALEKAKNEHKVILVSIGYSACHWCHVMEKESFENLDTATLMNQHFVNIKIDREERPDLDHIYMDAVQAIAGSGGWPLNVFLTPAAKPFYGGTYYPPVKAFNRSSWTEVLLAIAMAWQERRNEIESQAENLIAHLNSSSTSLTTNLTDLPPSEAQLFSMPACDTIFDNIMKIADREWGGFGRAPKFPQTFTIQYLLQYQHFTKNSDALQQALLSLDKMLEGGIYDHLAGGMARYSTDREWLAPHFEKMLYDNALLIDVLCDAWLITKDKKYKEAVLKTTRFLLNEMTDAEGGFYAALDADSEGVEGKYYVWQKEEIDTILGDNAILFCKFFDVSKEGNWEGVNILRVIKTPVEFASANNIDEAMFESFIKDCIQKLSAIRSERVRPALDDKIILGWNALALKAIAKAAVVFEDEELKAVAIKNFRFIENRFIKNESSAEMLHTYKNGIAKYPAFLDDYAFLIAACFEIYELTFDVNYLRRAKKWTEFVISNFSDDQGIFFFFTHQSQKDIVVRKIELYDGAVCSGNSSIAHSLFKLSIIFNISSWRHRSLKMLTLNSQATIKYPSSFGVWASFLLQTVVGLNELAVIGQNFYQLSRKISHNYIPYKALMASDRENDEFPLLQNKPAETESLIYYCKNYTCFEPVADVNELILHIDKSLK